MGLIAQLLSFVRSTTDEDAHVTDVKIDPGGGALVTAQHFAPPGDDSHPLPGDFVACVPSGGTGTQSAVGYIDPANEPAANEGEKRLYARNSNGDVVAVVWLKNDGEVLVHNVVADNSIRVLPDGSVHIGDADHDVHVAGNAAKLARADRTNAELEKIENALIAARVMVDGTPVPLEWEIEGTNYLASDVGADRVYGT